jgi:hypothetical protein
MKKLLFLVLFTCVTSVVINAQLAVGGSFSFSTTGGSTNGTDKSSTTTFSFMPIGGYFVSEDLLVGAQLNFSIDRVKTPGTTEIIEKTSLFGLSPFARYYAVRFQKLSLYGQAQLTLNFEKEKTKTGGTTNDGPKTTDFGFSILPGIAYDLNDKIQLQASINVASFGFSSSVVKSANGDKDKTTNFGFGANLNTIINTGNFTIGAIVKL